MLEHVKEVCPQLVTKSSIMLGCGESDHQVLQTLRGMCVHVCACVCVCVGGCVGVCVCGMCWGEGDKTLWYMDPT